MSAAARVLVVDDERMNREVIVANLRAAGYETVTAEDGVQAWTVLDGHPGEFDLVLLDRRMPRMNGMELLVKIKADERLRTIPVVMQTAYAETEDITAGIQAGAYYYLAKPLDRRVLLSVTDAAIGDHRRLLRLQDDLEKRSTAMILLEGGRFRFRTLDEGHTLAVALARMCPGARHLVVGLSELFTNAVEHGNLGISFEEKAQLVAAKTWSREIEARLDTPEGRGRRVEVEVSRGDGVVRFVIRDQGGGFDWRRFTRLDPARAFAAHGRGIALARRLAFDAISYNEPGNEVTATIAIDDDTRPAPCLTALAPAEPAVAGEEAGAAGLAAAVPVPAAAPAAAGEGDSGAEWRMAQVMQRELLPAPSELARLERRFAVGLSSHVETSSGLGGDLWGAADAGGGLLAVWLADFAGHGLVAALNTFRLHSLVENCRPLACSPAGVLNELNRRLVGLLPVGHYATMVYGVLDQANHAFRYAAAAAPPPLVRHADGRVEAGNGAGLPLGVAAAANYQERLLPLGAGAALVLASDGLSDNPAEDGARLGRAGVAELVAAPAENAQAMLAPFLARVARPLADDLTVIRCALG